MSPGAASALAGRTILPTDLSAAQLAGIEAALRERSFFSARTTHAGYLQQARDLLLQLVAPETKPDGTPAGRGEYMDVATARLQLRQYLDKIGYRPEEGKEGTIQDLRSDPRINLVLRQNQAMLHGYAWREQGQTADVLDQWPAQELVRFESRRKARDWPARWRVNGGPVTRAWPRMIALKNDGIWIRISAFGLPYDPFDYGSGMGLRDVDRAEAEELGLIKPQQAVAPEPRPVNEDLEASAPVRDARLREALLESMAGKAELVAGVLRWIGGE